MPNFLQKWIYNLSSAAPLCLVFAFVWLTQYKTFFVPLICCGVSIILFIAFKVSFAYCKRNLPPISIRISELAPHDAWIVAYIISYIVPFASIAIEDFNPWLSGAIAAAIVFIAPFVNSSAPNPLLFVSGYHFYQIKSEHGSNYIFISKRKIRNVKEIKHIQRVFEFLLMEDIR